MSSFVYITRSLTICSGHRLNSGKLSPEANRKLYGKCNHHSGHGHNYEILVTVKGRVDPVTGIVMNTNELRQHMERCILDELDHKHLDEDIPYFKEHTSTSENIAIYIWDLMKPRLNDLLYEVKVISTAKNAATYRGEK